ncbi:MAG: hypothetical protein ACE5KJ_05440 [Candidatus Zixiibacteriota bacterium]
MPVWAGPWGQGIPWLITDAPAHYQYVIVTDEIKGESEDSPLQAVGNFLV